MSSSVLLKVISQIRWISFTGWEYDTVKCLDVILSCTLGEDMDFSRGLVKVLTITAKFPPQSFKYHKAAFKNIEMKLTNESI